MPQGHHPVKKRLLSEPSKDETERVVVKLYKVAHGHDHFLGDWMVVDGNANDVRPHMILQRRAEQTDVLATGRVTRSESERAHGKILTGLFGPPFVVDFEPECASGLRVACVEKGRQSQWCSDLYTVDFVVSDVARGLWFAVESKSNVASLDRHRRTLPI